MLLAQVGDTSIARRQVRLLEPSVLPGQYRQVVADTGEGGAVHNSVRLRLQTTTSLLSWAEIAVSSDLKTWRVVRARAPIYVLRQEAMGENTDVTYPDSVSRYVRIRVMDGSDAYALVSAEIGFETASKAEHAPAGIALANSTSRTGDSVWTSDADASAWPVSRVQFQAPATTFRRHVIIQTSNDGEQWQTAGGGDILRAPDAAGDRAWLTIDVPETYARRWRITVNNRSDAPVDGLSPALLSAVRRVVLKQEPGASYRLLYGNPRGRAADYDMARTTDRKALEAAEPATLGAEEENTGWVDPSPWTERHDAALWAALIVAVIVLGVVAVRTLRG